MEAVKAALTHPIAKYLKDLKQYPGHLWAKRPHRKTEQWQHEAEMCRERERERDEPRS